MPLANPAAGKRPSSDGRSCPLYLGLFGEFQRIIKLYSRISNGAFQLDVAKQELHGPKILGPPVHH
jgi:predicted metal-binding protein